MLRLVALLLIIWVGLMILGAVIKGLFWLLVVGAVLFLATSAYGWLKREGSGG